jgi:hypothetical protein
VDYQQVGVTGASPTMHPISKGWTSSIRSGCMLAFGVVWTLFALSFFGIAWVAGAPWFFQVFAVPFVLVGVALVGSGIWTLLIRPALLARYFGPASAALSSEQVRVGDRLTDRYEQPVKTDVEIGPIRMLLILREWAQYRRGTDTYTVTHDNSVDTYEAPGRRMYRGDTISEEHSFLVPSDSMHSVIATHNKLLWLVKVSVAVPAAPDVAEELPFEVVPELAEEANGGNTI